MLLRLSHRTFSPFFAPDTYLDTITDTEALICLSQALVDAPDMVRSQMNFKRLSLTDIKIDIKRIPRKSSLIKAMQEAGRHTFTQTLDEPNF